MGKFLEKGSPADGHAANKNRIIAHLVPFIAMGVGLYIVNNAWVAMLGYHLGMLVFLMIDRQGQIAKDLFRGGKVLPVLLALLAGASSGLILYAVARFSVPDNFTELLGRQGLRTDSWMPFMLYYSFINPVIEEYYWRGYLGSKTNKISMSDICYAGYHPLVLIKFIPWPWVLVEFGVLLAAAWVWRLTARMFKGLLIPVVTHFAADVSIIVAVYTLAIK
jgi:hypothetical protein